MENLDRLSEVDYVPTKVHSYPQSTFLKRDFTYLFSDVGIIFHVDCHGTEIYILFEVVN